MKLVMCAGHSQKPLMNSKTLVLCSSTPQPSAFPTPCSPPPALPTSPCTTSSIRKASQSHGRGPGCPAECRLQRKLGEEGQDLGGNQGWLEGRSLQRGLHLLPEPSQAPTCPGPLTPPPAWPVLISPAYPASLDPYKQVSAEPLLVEPFLGTKPMTDSSRWYRKTSP